MRLGFAAIARTTFDIDHAAEQAAAARLLLTGHDVSGPTDLITEARTVGFGDVDALVLLMATFADATIPLSVVGANRVPVVLWGVPEPRTGGRLRLNSLCGINLAAYSLLRRGHDVRWVYCDPSDAGAGDQLAAALAGPAVAAGGVAVAPDTAAGDRLAATLAKATVGLVGEPPTGFEPCVAEPALVAAVGSVVESVSLDALFERGRGQYPDRAGPLVAGLAGLADLDPAGVDTALRLHLGLSSLVESHRWDGVATRCWPECFTEFGAAACAGQGLLADRGIPATCEADVPGTLTALALRHAARTEPVVLDLVDVADDGTMAFWHCGLAPLSTGDGVPEGVDHPNRGLPLLRQFRFRPGPVTIARFTVSGGRPRLALGGGRVLDRPRPFHGTSGVVAMDRDGHDVLATIMGEGLDHHYGLVHGDVRAEMAGLADRLGLPVVWL